MITFVIKIIFISIFICSNGVFAFDKNIDIETLKKQNLRVACLMGYCDTEEKRMLEENDMDYDDIYIFEAGKSATVRFVDGWCEKTFEHTHKTKYIYKREKGMIKTEKYISHHKDSHALNYANDYERIITIHDKKGNLLFSKHYTWVDNMLMRTVDGDTIRNIIQGKTPCDFTIVEPSGDSISYHLHPKKKIVGSIKNNFAFSEFINGYSVIYKDYNKKYNVYDAIIYQRHSYCKEYYEKNNEYELLYDSVYLNAEKESDISITDDESFLYTYKYYIIFIISIIVVSVTVLYKRCKKK